PHHDARHGLALQPLCRTGARSERRRPCTVRRARGAVVHAGAEGATLTIAAGAARTPPPSLNQSARRIFALAWPVLVGQLAVLAFSTIDTVMVARHSALDLAALAIGGAAYISVFVGLMGVVLAVGPIAGQLFGAARLVEAGRELHQAV